MEEKKTGRAAAALTRVSSLIVRGRFVIFALFAVAVVFCALSVGRVRVNPELTRLLPPDSETLRGISVMEDEFETAGSAEFMVEDISLYDALALRDKLAGVGHVVSVSFDDTAAHYSGSSALFSFMLDSQIGTKESSEALDGIRALLSGYTTYEYTGLGKDFSESLARQMVRVVMIAAAVIAGVLIFTSRSYFEVVIFLIVFPVAAVLNMGTNFLLGEISTVSNTVAVILQLALAIDYAIIFAHRYQDEAAETDDKTAALIAALSKSIIEISSSCLTTVAGLCALTLMQFRLGYDLGIVLVKGIFCSMLTVFLLMPGLIGSFPRAIEATRHRSFVPDVGRWGRFIVKRGAIFAVLFALILPAAAVMAARAPYSFDHKTVDPIIRSDIRDALDKIGSTFERSTPLAVIIPGGDYEKEAALLAELKKTDGINSAVGLTDIVVKDGLNLTDSVTVADVAALGALDEGNVDILFRLYGVEKGLLTSIFDGTPVSAPLVDLIAFFADHNDSTPEGIASAVKQIRQLKGKEHDRIVLTSPYPSESEEGRALVETVREESDALYGAGSTIVTGDITSARDLYDSFRSDRVLISALTVVFVFAVLLFTFRSVTGSALLVLLIQGSIWCNFAVAYLVGMKASFVTEMITTAVQMGATIDYAIVIMNRYLSDRRTHEKKEAAVLAVRESFATVITSGAIMTLAGFIIAFGVTNVYVGHIGLAVGRGAAFSVLLVLTVLPPLLVICDRAIIGTTFGKKRRAFLTADGGSGQKKTGDEPRSV